MKQLESYFKSLADRNRLRILNLLLHGELCGCDIQYVLGSSQPNVSRHLQYLKNTGLVMDRRDGFRIFYRLVAPARGTTQRLFEFLQQAFKEEPGLQEDTRRLKAAIQHGACTQTEWRPFVALQDLKSSRQGRAQ